MSRIQINKLFFVILATAFLAAQWSNAHIHLSKSHHHDGGHHTHTTLTHAHQPGTHHADAIDVGHSAAEERVVELDQESTSGVWKKPGDHADLLAQTAPHILHTTADHQATTPALISVEANWLAYTQIRPRAPPHSPTDNTTTV